MKATLIETMGSDLTVVNAARVSFKKESDWDRPEYHPDRFVSFEPRLYPKDEKLIDYLAMHNHFTPFTHCFATFHIKAPIFVARQLFKHKIGLTENEVSRRYVDDELEFYTPEVWRERAVNKKQGSGPGEVKHIPWEFPHTRHELFEINDVVNEFYVQAETLYKTLLAAHVAPEQARMVLPQGMYTEWYWSGSIAAFARVYNQRTGPDAQAETGEIAKQIGEELAKEFPVSWKALT